ncbi:hypothetical protein YC2023_037606 [Brassica napus]
MEKYKSDEAKFFHNISHELMHLRTQASYGSPTAVSGFIVNAITIITKNILIHFFSISLITCISHPTAMEFFETNFYQATPYIDQFGWQNVDSKETLSSLDQTQVCLDSLRPQMEQCLYLNRLSLDSKFICNISHELMHLRTQASYGSPTAVSGIIVNVIKIITKNILIHFFSISLIMLLPLTFLTTFLTMVDLSGSEKLQEVPDL